MDRAPGHKDSRFLTTHRGLSSHSWSQLLRSIPLSKFPSPFYFPNFFFPFLFPLLYLPEFPFSFLPSLFPFLITILSCFSKRVGGLVDLHLHPYSHIMSPTDCRIILYLTVFTVTGSRVQAFISHVPRYPFCTQKIHDLHFDHQTHRELLSISSLLY
jgi:hypothetical protein